MDVSLQGPVNAVSPNPVTNAEFTRILGRVLRRPAILPVPRFVLEMIFGEMGREALLPSFRVKPAKLMAAGFEFRFPDLEMALRHLLASATRASGVFAAHP
jgi:NAD dependent epimerase/dehydratase family enzyme